MHPATWKFLVIESKTFDVGIAGKRVEGMRVSENKKWLRLTLSFLGGGEEIEWHLGVLQEFYRTRKGVLVSDIRPTKITKL